MRKETEEKASGSVAHSRNTELALLFRTQSGPKPFGITTADHIFAHSLDLSEIYVEMRKDIPSYSSTGLQVLLNDEVAFPKQINELDFQHQIQLNKKICWDVNPSVLEDDCLRTLLNASHFINWRAVPRVGQIIGTFIAYWCLRTRTVEILLMLPILPFAIVPLPRFLFVFCVGGAVAAKLYFHLVIPLFWVLIGLAGIGFAFTKSIEDLAKRLVIKQGLYDWETFWRYYSNQIIYPDWTYDTEETNYLLQRYPELVN